MIVVRVVQRRMWTEGYLGKAVGGRKLHAALEDQAGGRDVQAFYRCVAVQSRGAGNPHVMR